MLILYKYIFVRIFVYVHATGIWPMCKSWPHCPTILEKYAASIFGLWELLCRIGTLQMWGKKYRNWGCKLAVEWWRPTFLFLLAWLSPEGWKWHVFVKYW